ncbi:hypothetical protein LOK69_00520 [Escherichia coli]|uniref:hypothetical protein n=1 Tax=Escherichia coli TaxID=562 RepID=UPI001E32F90C|nr:hypothetical protein [Escherichia coli]MCC9296991.1 hypothetical protein [Escherichia coli]MCC9301538.1 hypothetical protein [Escherichia coli]MCZ0409735.1 hypothetical protein [Escherichia coli]UIR42863.1 hypothetical protein LZ175_06060 [Escherichia coli]UUF71453.1 hypothetical protein NPX81_06065 [Escherichia coli]
MSESKELVLVTLPAAAELEAAFISDDYITSLIADIRQKASSVVGDVATVKGRGVYISMASTVRRTKTVMHRRGINAAAVQSLIDQGIPDDWAKACVVAIARGKVPATTINY